MVLHLLIETLNSVTKLKWCNCWVLFCCYLIWHELNSRNTTESKRHANFHVLSWHWWNNLSKFRFWLTKTYKIPFYWLCSTIRPMGGPPTYVTSYHIWNCICWAFRQQALRCVKKYAKTQFLEISWGQPYCFQCFVSHASDMVEWLWRPRAGSSSRWK